MENEIKLELSKLSDEVKKVVRRQDDLQKSVDLLFADRQILEDVQGSIKHLQEIILANQEHQDISKKDLKADIKDVQNVVEAKVDEVKLGIDEKTILVKSTKQGIFNKLMSILKGGELNNGRSNKSAS